MLGIANLQHKMTTLLCVVKGFTGSSLCHVVQLNVPTSLCHFIFYKYRTICNFGNIPCSLTPLYLSLLLLFFLPWMSSLLMVHLATLSSNATSSLKTFLISSADLVAHWVSTDLPLMVIKIQPSKQLLNSINTWWSWLDSELLEVEDCSL